MLKEVSTQSYGNACLHCLFMMEETRIVSWSFHPIMMPKGKGVSQGIGIPGKRNEACTAIEEREEATCLECCWWVEAGGLGPSRGMPACVAEELGRADHVACT